MQPRSGVLSFTITAFLALITIFKVLPVWMDKLSRREKCLAANNN
jgi:hypothetical protein